MVGRKIFAPGRLTRQIQQRYGKDEGEEASAEDMTAAAIRMRARYGLAKDESPAKDEAEVDAGTAEKTAEKEGPEAEE